MKLVKQIELIFQGGTSDKVYEVDLCEVGSNQYVVNFRYGRRGSTLKEGTKTALPVAWAKAEQVFDKLVASKVKKGYIDIQAPVEVQTPAGLEPPSAAAPVQSDDPREQAVLERLQAGDLEPPRNTARSTDRGGRSRRRQQPNKIWPLNRVIWRAGELKLHAAEPLLLQLISSTDHVRNYCIIAALAHCGTEQSLPHLRHFDGTAGFPDHVRRLAAAALLMLLPDADREAFREQLLGRLPSPLSDAARNGLNTEFQNTLEAYLARAKAVDYAVLPTLYLIDNAHTRPAILAWLRQSSLRPPEVKPLRHIFKLAELRRDAEVFGLIAYRFETTGAMFRHDMWGEGAFIPNSYQYVEADELRRELGATNAKLAYSEKTRAYLRRRVWRTLRRLGELGLPDYAPMAADVLLMYSDNDASSPCEVEVYRKPQNTTRRRWDEYVLHRVKRDAYSAYWALNHILYRHSPRYVQMSQTWYCHDNYKPGDPEPDGREEAFPELWQQAPAQLLRLLQQSHCQPVHAFAVKALRTCTEFCGDLDCAILIELLRSPYDCTAQFGFELAESRFDPSQPDLDLLYAGLVSRYTLARERMLTWLQALPEHHAESLLQRLFAYLLSLDEDDAEHAERLSATLMASTSTLLERLDLSIVRQLLSHSLIVLQQLGGDILLHHHESIPFELIELLLNAEHEILREFGTRLLEQLPDTELAQHLELVTVLASHADPAMRDAATPLLRRLKPSHGGALTELLMLRLSNLNLSDGVPSHVLQLLQSEFQAHLAHVGSELIWRLLRAQYAQAHELGGILLKQNVDPATISVKQIVTLADHDVLAVRRAARDLCHQNMARLKQDMAETIKLLEAKWDDSRAFAFELFTEQMGPDELRPDILVGICDSVKEEVQQFGRRCITQYFQEADGQDYMLKLSEHPSVDMQLFVTNYLERYASGYPARLKELKPYFFSALSMVNKGRMTKQRLYAFLHQEALKSETAAQIVTSILARQSATIAVGDRANAIQILLQLRKTYPHLDSPLKRREAALR